MFKILGETYYIDLDKMESYINIPQESGATEQHISVVKYDMVKLMAEVVMSVESETDETLGLKNSDLSIPFKLAFNTLLNKKIINKY
jgi:hypothetical protein